MTGVRVPGVRRMWVEGELVVGDEEPVAAAEARAQRIADARERLARAAMESPGSVSRYHARQAKLSAAAHRERRRFELLVLGAPIDPAIDAGTDETILRAARLREEWSYKRNGTPETHEHASHARQGSLAQLYANGSISIEQLQCAVDIADISASITAAVAVHAQQIGEMVHHQARPTGAIEGVKRARLCRAYTHWRNAIPNPRAAVLAMIIGEPIGYSVAARRYRMHPRRAKRLLIHALDLWPNCLDLAFDEVDRDRLNEIHARLA